MEHRTGVCDQVSSDDPSHLLDAIEVFDERYQRGANDSYFAVHEKQTQASTVISLISNIARSENRKGGTDLRDTRCNLHPRR